MNLNDLLNNKLTKGCKYALMGIGSKLRSDDSAGMYFIELLSDLKQHDLLLIAGSTAPENFTGVIKKFAPDVLFIVDAAHMGLLPGEFKAVVAEDICGVTFSTHMLPLPVMLKYLEAECGTEVLFIGIQPKCTKQGLIMSEEVMCGTKKLAETFRNAFNRSGITF